MSRHGKKHQRALHLAALRLEDGEEKGFEPRLSYAFQRATKRFDNTLSINNLAALIHECQVLKRQGKPWAHLVDAELRRSLPVALVKETYAPVGAIVVDAFMRGGRLGAEHVNEVTKE